MSLIIIPYREREEHLKYFIENTYPLIKKYMDRVGWILIGIVALLVVMYLLF